MKGFAVDKNMKLSTEHREALIKSASRHGDIDAKMIHNWIKDLHFISQKLANKDLNHTYIEGTFWIRLYGLLTEVRDNFEYVSKEIVPLLSKDSEPEMKQVIMLTDLIYQEIQGIITDLSDEEHLVIDNLRQTNCHVLQKGFRLGVKDTKTGKILKERYCLAVTKKVMLISDMDRVFDEYYRAYGANQMQMALDINAKIKNRIDNIHNASIKRMSL